MSRPLEEILEFGSPFQTPPTERKARVKYDAAAIRAEYILIPREDAARCLRAIRSMASAQANLFEHLLGGEG